MMYYHVYGLYATLAFIPITWGIHMPSDGLNNVRIFKKSYHFDINEWVDWSKNSEALTMLAIGV
jgi:hypothetical protein